MSASGAGLLAHTETQAIVHDFLLQVNGRTKCSHDDTGRHGDS